MEREMTPTHRVRFDFNEPFFDVEFVPKGKGLFDVVRVPENEIVGTYDKLRKLYSWDVFETMRNYQIQIIRDESKGNKK
jgi:hypothetical protein